MRRRTTHWTCPACGRTFGRNRQGHLCVPVRQLDEFLDAQPHREIFQAVVDHVQTLQGAIIEPGDAYLMLKRRRKFAALTPRRRWVRLWFILPHAIDHDRIQSRTKDAGAGVAHYVQLHTTADVDDTLRDWLTQSWETCAP